MKKFIIAASLIFLGLGSAFAQQGKQAVGGSLSYGTETESVGIGAKYHPPFALRFLLNLS